MPIPVGLAVSPYRYCISGFNLRQSDFFALPAEYQSKENREEDAEQQASGEWEVESEVFPSENDVSGKLSNERYLVEEQ